MKIMITVIGILIVLAGILPLLSGIWPDSALTKKPGYQFVIIAVGFIGLIYGAMNSMLFGLEKFVTISLGLMTLIGGVLPFLGAAFLSGTTYPLVIIGIGIVGIIYGFLALG